jgi:hypothetical protein
MMGTWSIEKGPRVRVVLALGSDQRSVAAEASAAEALDYDGVATGEHLFFHGPVTNAFVSLAAAAGARSRIRLLSSLTVLPLYPAALAAKLATTLDQVSNGRFDLGVGIGGEYPKEFVAAGVQVADRGARADEALTLLKALSPPHRPHPGQGELSVQGLVQLTVRRRGGVQVCRTASFRPAAWRPGTGRSAADGSASPSSPCPSTVTDPDVGRSSRLTGRTSVLLPDPLGPTTPANSPASIGRLTPSTATTSPARPRAGNTLRTSVRSIMAWQSSGRADGTVVERCPRLTGGGPGVVEGLAGDRRPHSCLPRATVELPRRGPGDQRHRAVVARTNSPEGVRD